MFEYYFTLTTSNGTEIDVIAGQSAFLPVAVAANHNDKQPSTSVRNITLSGASKRPDDLPDFVQNSEWPPQCVSLETWSCHQRLDSLTRFEPHSPLQDDGGDANFTVSLLIPNGERLDASKQASVTLIGLGVPWLMPFSCRRQLFHSNSSRQGGEQY
jgi:hypothetical protein